MAEAQNDYARKRRGVHLSAPNKDTIHLPMQLSYSTVKCIQNNCTPTACLPSLKVICRLKDSSCQSMMNTMYTDKSSVRSRISRKTHWSVNNLKKRSWRLAMMLLGMIHQTQLPQSLKWIISLDSLTQAKYEWLPRYLQVTEIILRMFIKSVLSIFLLIIFYLSCPWGRVKHTMMLKVAIFNLWLFHTTSRAPLAILNYSHCHNVQIDTWNMPYIERACHLS